jgi:uncharacterized protein (TIGR00369 family)
MTNPESFPPIDAAQAKAIVEALNAEAFHLWIGLRFEELRLGYARLRIAHRPELEQDGGVVHGGVIASALDAVAFGAIRSMLADRPSRAATIDLHVQFLDAVSGEDVIAEARVRRRGKSIVFVEADARTDGGRALAHGEASWVVRA